MPSRSLALILIQVFGRVIADVAMFSLRPGPSTKVAEFHELRVRRRDMVGFVERLHGDLPIAVEHQPPAPSVAHVLQLKGIEDAGGGLEIVAQGFAAGIHIDPDPTAPGTDADLAEVRALRRSARPSSPPSQAHGCTRHPG